MEPPRLPRPILAAALLAGLAGCHVQFVSPYDDTFDQQITAAQRDTDDLMSRIAADPSKPYTAVADRYHTVQVDLDALAVRASSHPNNTDTVNSVAKLQHTFGEFRNLHATNPGALTAKSVQDELGIMNHEYAILMGQELAKKSGT